MACCMVQDPAAEDTLRHHSLDSSSPASNGHGDTRVPSIGSVIANLSIGIGRGAAVARQLASLREQHADAVDPGAAGAGSRQHDGSGTDAAGVSDDSVDASQAAPEAAALIQRQLTQLDLSRAGEAAATGPLPPALQQQTEQPLEQAGGSAEDVQPEPATNLAHSPQGKRLRQAAFSASEVPSSSSSPGQPAQTKQLRVQPRLHAHAAPRLATPLGGDADAAHMLPPRGSGNASPQALSSPGKNFQACQPHFTLGAPGEGVPNAKRRQLPPAAQVQSREAVSYCEQKAHCNCVWNHSRLQLCVWLLMKASVHGFRAEVTALNRYMLCAGRFGSRAAANAPDAMAAARIHPAAAPRPAAFAADRDGALSGWATGVGYLSAVLACHLARSQPQSCFLDTVQTADTSTCQLLHPIICLCRRKRQTCRSRQCRTPGSGGHRPPMPAAAAAGGGPRAQGRASAAAAAAAAAAAPLQQRRLLA